MEAITLIDALMCELDPYTVSPKVCIKALMDNGVSDHSVSYDPDKDKVVVAKAAILSGMQGRDGLHHFGCIV